MGKSILDRKSALIVFALLATLVSNEILLGQDESVGELRRKATRAYQTENWGEAAQQFKRVVDLDPENGMDWHLLGYCQHMDGDLEAAINSHRKAAEFEEVKAISLYNLGCAYSLKKNADMSFDYLRKAFENGFDQAELLTSDQDLDNIRNDPRFTKLVAFANGEKVEVEMQESTVKKARGFDTKQLVGDWKMIAGQRSGENVDETRMPPSVKFSEKELVLPSPDGGDPFVMSFKIDATKKPMQIDLNIESGPVPAGEAKGILELQGNRMKICYDGMTGTRPEKFETTEDDGYFMFVLRKKDNSALANLLGDWKYTAGTKSGEKLDAAALGGGVKVDEKTITLPAGPDQFVMSYKVDTSSSPMKIDMKIESGPAPAGAPALGIIEISKDSFKICYEAAGGKRPKKFESTAENGHFLFELKREKKD